jgi:NMD protein affecting ribosome stability and mRNA decay
MDVDLLQHLRSRRTLRSTKQRADLVTCSLCLRVRQGSEWREAEQVIRELRSYELEAPPRLHSAVCEVCAESIFSRRVAEEIRVEAA